MLKVKSLRETNNIKPIMLRAFIAKKITALMNEFSVDTLDDIGCFVVLDKEEFSDFSISEMEFVEVLEIGENHYLHGARILGDSYGEDVYLPVEVLRK